MKGALRLLHHPPKLPVQEPTGKANILIKTSLGLQSKICRINIFKFSNQRDCAAGQHRVPAYLIFVIFFTQAKFLENRTVDMPQNSSIPGKTSKPEEMGNRNANCVATPFSKIDCKKILFLLECF